MNKIEKWDTKAEFALQEQNAIFRQKSKMRLHNLSDLVQTFSNHFYRHIRVPSFNMLQLRASCGWNFDDLARKKHETTPLLLLWQGVLNYAIFHTHLTLFLKFYSTYRIFNVCIFNLILQPKSHLISWRLMKYWQEHRLCRWLAIQAGDWQQH